MIVVELMRMNFLINEKILVRRKFDELLGKDENEISKFREKRRGA